MRSQSDSASLNWLEVWWFETTAAIRRNRDNPPIKRSHDDAAWWNLYRVHRGMQGLL